MFLCISCLDTDVPETFEVGPEEDSVFNKQDNHPFDFVDPIFQHCVYCFAKTIMQAYLC